MQILWRHTRTPLTNSDFPYQKVGVGSAAAPAHPYSTIIQRLACLTTSILLLIGRLTAHCRFQQTCGQSTQVRCLLFCSLRAAKRKLLRRLGIGTGQLWGRQGLWRGSGHAPSPCMVPAGRHRHQRDRHHHKRGAPLPVSSFCLLASRFLASESCRAADWHWIAWLSPAPLYDFLHGSV